MLENFWIVPLVFVLVMVFEALTRKKPKKPIEHPLSFYGGCWNPEPKKIEKEEKYL